MRRCLQCYLRCLIWSLDYALRSLYLIEIVCNRSVVDYSGRSIVYGHLFHLCFCLSTEICSCSYLFERSYRRAYYFFYLVDFRLDRFGLDRLNIYFTLFITFCILINLHLIFNLCCKIINLRLSLIL